MSGNAFVNGIKYTEPVLYKKIAWSINYGLRAFKKKGGIEGIDYVVCKICGAIKYGSMNTHLNVHGITEAEYSNEYGTVKTVNDVCFKSGEDNPAYQHGGKLSPWSFKSNHHTKEEVEQFRKNIYDNKVSVRQVQYWTDKGLTEDEAKIEIGKMQTRDLFFFQKKYGEEEGLRRRDEKVKKWINSLDSKSEEEKKIINRKKIWKNGFRSKSEINLFNMLQKEIPEILNSLIVYNKKTKKHLIYDIVFNNKIIEYNGDVWHGNPKKYSKLDVPPVFKSRNITAEELWKKDKLKLQYAENIGYEVLTVWESDFKNNQNKVVEECLNFLKA